MQSGIPLANLRTNLTAFRLRCLSPTLDQMTGPSDIICPSPVAFYFPAAKERKGTATVSPMQAIRKERQENCSAGKCGWKCRSSRVINWGAFNFVKTALLAADTGLLLQQHKTDVATGKIQLPVCCACWQ